MTFSLPSPSCLLKLPIDAIKTVHVPDNHKQVPIDSKSLFTSIPVHHALDCTKTAINKAPYQPPLPTDELTDLVHLSLTSTYFRYNGKPYKQLHGTAMGSPVSVVVVKIVIQNRLSAEVVETSVANNRHFQDFGQPENHFLSK